MRRTTTALLLSALLLVWVAPLAQADEPPPLIITPYIGGPQYYAEAGQEVVIRAGWGACNRGLTQQFINAVSISMEVRLAGETWLRVEPPSREYWRLPAPHEEGDPSACVLHTNTVWLTEWLYSLGPLASGEYELHFLYTLTRPVVDGGDYDSDGRPDIFSGVRQDRMITIYVS